MAPVEFQAGQTINVTWEETINHPGRYYISWSPSNQNLFAQNRLAEIPDVQDGAVNRNDPNSWHQYSMSVTLPNVQCDSCVLQLIQSMEENPNAPTFYYSCADIRIVAAGNTTPPVVDDSPPVADPGTNVDAQTTGEVRQKPQMGSGCGLVAAHYGGKGPGGPQGPLALLLLALPILLIRKLRVS